MKIKQKYQLSKVVQVLEKVLYEKAGILVKKGLSGSVCPDHFFASIPAFSYNTSSSV